MNAGAYGKEMKDVVLETKYMDIKGETHNIDLAKHEFSYRKSIFSTQNYIILETTLKLKKGKKEEIQAKMQEYQNLRKEKQPYDYPSAGSTFKRGKDFITAELIDKCGLKGKKIGGAMVSDKHAGFIVNTGNATFQDVLDLIEFVKNIVYEKTCKQIELEIEIVN